MPQKSSSSTRKTPTDRVEARAGMGALREVSISTSELSRKIETIILNSPLGRSSLWSIFDLSVMNGPTSKMTDWVNVGTVVALTFIGIIVYGLDRADLSLIAEAFWGVTLILACRTLGIRQTILKFRTLKLAAFLFSALIIWILFSLGDWSPGGDLPWWHWIGGRSRTLDRSGTLLELVRLLGLAATFVVGLCIGSSDRRAEMFLRAVCVTGAVYGLVALSLYAFDPSLDIRAAQTGFENRLTATFFSANISAGFFGLLATLTLSGISVSDKASSQRSVQDFSFMTQYGILVLFLGGIVLSASRLGTFSTIAGMAVAALLHFLGVRNNDNRWRYIGPQGIGFALFGLLAIAGQLLMTRMSSVSGELNGRRALYDAHWSAFLQRPISGYGLGSFAPLNRLLETPANFEDLWYVRAAHNVYLQWLEETGLVGAGLMFSVIAIILFEIFQGQRQRKSVRWTMRGILGASVTVLVHGMGDFSLQTPAIAILWALLLGVGYAVATGGHRGELWLAQNEQARPPKVEWWAPVGLALAIETAALVVLWGTGNIAAQQGFPVVMRTAYLDVAHNSLSGPKTAETINIVRNLALNALRQSPVDDYAWTLLAQIGEGTPEGRMALHRSYLAAPFDPPLFKWRVTLAADQWTALPEEDRAAVIRDIAAERKRFWETKVWLSEFARSRKDDGFGLGLSLISDLADHDPSPQNAESPSSTQK